jgi:amino acid ABC transporter substrate-binding protein, PAAT family (TC 3.A.1.3.-)
MDRRSYIKSGAGVIAGGLIAGCTGSDSESESTATADSSAGTDTPTDTVSDTETATAESVVPSNVVIGSDIPYRPFEYETTSGELTGFDVDIAQAVFEDQLGVNYEFKPTSFDSIIPSLNNGNFRIIMSAMTINDTRDEKVDFSIRISRRIKPSLFEQIVQLAHAEILRVLLSVFKRAQLVQTLQRNFNPSLMEILN